VLPETETDLRQWNLFEDTVDSGRRAAEFAMSELSRDELDAFGL
jgi:NTE family protein